MARYAIGDIQGCHHTFQALLARINFNPKVDELWLVGDLINRGSGSLEVLRWCYEHQDNLKVVLGNHDLHALSQARAEVNAVKISLGERGPVWWTDGAQDFNRHLVKNTPYAEWYQNLGGS